MGDSNAINNLAGAITSTVAYNGSYWQGANICADGSYSSLVWTGDSVSINSNLDYGFTLNEDAIKEIVEKLTKQKETAKITPDAGPEIPK